MRKTFGFCLLALMAALIGFTVPAPAHATTYGFILYDVADSYCLTAFLNQCASGCPVRACQVRGWRGAARETGWPAGGRLPGGAALRW